MANVLYFLNVFYTSTCSVMKGKKTLGQGTMIIFGRHYLLSYEAARHFPLF